VSVVKKVCALDHQHCAIVAQPHDCWAHRVAFLHDRKLDDSPFRRASQYHGRVDQIFVSAHENLGDLLKNNHESPPWPRLVRQSLQNFTASSPELTTAAIPPAVATCCRQFRCCGVGGHPGTFTSMLTNTATWRPTMSGVILIRCQPIRSPLPR
jgi:hypothetical protein